MFGRLKRVFARSERIDPTILRDTRNAWIKTKCRDWQILWHGYFDVDQDLIAAGEFERPDGILDEFYGDHRLVFGLPRSTPLTRKKCFALFPNGEEMNLRFEEYLTSKPVPISELQARSKLARVINLIEEIGFIEETDFSSVEIVDRDTDEGLAKLNHTDDIEVLVERSSPDLDQDDELERRAADLFLSEPLYVSAGNCYQLGNWVTAVLRGGREDALKTELYRMWDGGWEVRLGEKGVILAHRRV